MLDQLLVELHGRTVILFFARAQKRIIHQCLPYFLREARDIFALPIRFAFDPEAYLRHDVKAVDYPGPRPQNVLQLVVLLGEFASLK